MELKLKGIPGIIAVVIIVAGLIGYRVFLQSDLSENPELRQQLETNLMPEIAGDIMADAKAMKEAIDRGDNKTATALATDSLKRKVEINALGMKGSGEDIIVKATYTVHGPKGMENKIGYFRYSYSAITGWRYRREVTVYSWYLKLF